MDLSAYAALGGFERVAVIVGALIIGYWGYRLYGRENRTPGLVFMGIACAVLVLALATGGAYLRSVGTSYQLAGAGTGMEQKADRADADQPEIGVQATAGQRQAVATIGDGTVIARDTRPTGTDSANGGAEADIGRDIGPDIAAQELTVTAPAADTVAEEPLEPDELAEAPVTAPQPETDANPTQDLDLASSQELGGRIISVKSEKVSLEWSRE